VWGVKESGVQEGGVTWGVGHTVTPSRRKQVAISSLGAEFTWAMGCQSFCAFNLYISSQPHTMNLIQFTFS